MIWATLSELKVAQTTVNRRIWSPWSWLCYSKH